ncbi:MAG TPA: ATP-binding protein [Thermoanaerobaculia bacterium]|jgi:signal transduction histidine kinase|nr:ATP-binding protein [Thermoanaerobaculia bacterium]
MSSEPRLGRRLGLRREILILLPVALLLLAVLSSFTLFSYRDALSLLQAERQQEAARLARGVAEGIAAAGGQGVPAPEDLRRLAPLARGIALLDAQGRPLAATGDFPPAGLPASLAGTAIREPVAAGPNEELGDVVAGFAPLVGGRSVRVDLPAGPLAGLLRGLRILSAVVLSIDGALVLLVILFIRHLLAPYDTLLERAKQVGEPGAGEGEIEFLLATFERAVTELSRAEREPEDDIAAVERTLLASLESGLLLLDREGAVLAVNAVGAGLLGLAPPAPGTPLAAALASLPDLAGLLAGAVRQGGGMQRQECTLRVGEAERTLGLTVHPLRRDDGAIRGYLVLFADLTEPRKRAEEARLSESLARLGELAGGVAHELRNSLATLRGYLTLIERQPGEESAADYLGEIRTEADHLQRVLEDFLAFARPGTARFQEISLVPLLQRAAADPALDGFSVRLQAPEPGPHLQGDPQLLDRAIRNLLHNAVEAEREAGRSGPVDVRVRVEEQPDGIEIAIEDRGPGIRPEIRERLFHPFVTGRPGGVGLGLALAQRVVVLHGGRISLEDRDGGGARAVLFFPSEEGGTA